ncbi:chain length determinant protein EpsF [Aquabacterium olei]|uniref:Chain length determinant protein EpsF n=1 Tax=Aquabacterium olei TaxID=1296669 RepID=A0A2U8FTU8_9BURK|nr:chain length determinant protein EpsF [Aquabacterium olei]AWI54440.1 chain length determinant protein EpsF [Aquabacterium olei]
MTFEQLIAILRARWLIALSTFVLILGSVTTATLLTPKTYTASGSVVVDIKSPDPIAGMVLAGVAQPSFLMTQIDILTSSRVAQQVVRNLRLAESKVMQENWRESTGGIGDFQAWVAQLLRSSLEARPSRGSNVIYVSYKSPDPQFAAAIVNGFIRAYLETTVELRTDPAKLFNSQFDTSAKELKANLLEAQTRLSTFQQQQGLVINDERFDVETARLNELSAQLVSLQAVAADSGSRQAAAMTRTDQSPDIIANPLIAGLKGDVVRQEAQLQQFRAKYGENHPQVIELRSNVNDLRSKLESEVRRVAGSLSVSNTVNASRVAQLRASLEEQRAKVLKLKNIRDQAAVLQREVDSAQRALDGVVSRLQNSSLESMAQQSNVVALEVAKAPSVPSSPRLFTNVMLGGVGALVAALALVLGLELHDRRLRTLSEIEPVLGLQLLGSIPSFKKHEESRDLPKRLGLRRGDMKALPNNA